MTIVLLTDFGNSEYVGIMKGVIRSFTQVDIIDLTHSITSHNIIEAAWVLYKSYRFFPDNTTFCVVVDPCVGTQRQAIAVKTKNYCFVGPDNGVLWPAAVDDSIEEAVVLNTEGASPTFHGRDVFAPTAAHLETERDILSSLGQPTKTMEELVLTPVVPEQGMIVRIDHFGNVITNLPKPRSSGHFEIRIGSEKQLRRMKLFRTFADGPSDQPFIVLGSAETLEIVLRNDRAADLFSVNVGDTVELIQST